MMQCSIAPARPRGSSRRGDTAKRATRRVIAERGGEGHEHRAQAVRRNRRQHHRELVIGVIRGIGLTKPIVHRSA
jgi:hypothetical protein